MSAGRFMIVEVNPNDAIGGGGCLCSETKNPDCEGPYAVFFHTEMSSNISPHPVLCLSCAKAVVKRAETEDALAGGERDPVTDITPDDLVPSLRDEDSEPAQEDDVPEV